MKADRLLGKTKPICVRELARRFCTTGETSSSFQSDHSGTSIRELRRGPIATTSLDWYLIDAGKTDTPSPWPLIQRLSVLSRSPAETWE